MLKYNLDTSDDSRWTLLTPNINAKKLLFYVSEMGWFTCGPDFYTERAGKKEYFLIYTISGKGYMKYEEQEMYLMPGTAVFIDCSKYQLYKTAAEKWQHIWIHFNGSGCAQYYRLINEGGVNPIYIENQKLFLDIFESIMNNSGVNDMRQSLQVSKGINDLLTATSIGKFAGRLSKYNERHKHEIEKAIMYIRDNYDKQIMLSDFLGVVHLSKYYFLKLFKQYTGMSPYEYIINYRIDIAKSMLRESYMPVMQIAYMVGFSDESNFIRKFKNVTGMTPLAFRKMTG